MRCSGGPSAPLRPGGRTLIVLLPAAAPPFVSSHRSRPRRPPRLMCACSCRLPSTAQAPRLQAFSPTRPLPPPPFCWTLGVGTRTSSSCPGCVASPTVAKVDNDTESEVAMGYTMTQICDKFIDFFMNKKPQTKDWRKILVFREEWRRYKQHFYKHCQVRIDTETDSSVKQKLVLLARKVKKIDNEIEKHMELFAELRENPTDINAIVARRRKDFTGEFFRNLNFLTNAYNGLDEQDAIVRLGAKCLSAIHAYDCTLQQLDIDSTQAKFHDILNSSSLDDACEKVKSLAKAKELDSSLVLLINKAWAAAKDSKTMKNKGLLRVGLDKSVELLTDAAEGLRFALTDGVDVATDGTIYFTDASHKHSLRNFILDVLEARPHGRLMSFDPSTRRTTVLARDLYFPNGVALAPDQGSLIFCETIMRMCSRYHIKGDKEGMVERFIDRLPGLPDNVRYDGDGRYWIALSAGRTLLWDMLMGSPLLRKLVYLVNRYVAAVPKSTGGAGTLSVGLDGTPVTMYSDPRLVLATGWFKVGDYLYYGSLQNSYISRIDLTKSFIEA